MTISSTARKAGPFLGTGTTAAFPFAFKVFLSSDLALSKYEIATGAETVLVLDTDYSVTLNSDQDVNPGGTVTLIANLASGYSLVISSAVLETQETVLTNLGGFFPEVITRALDRLTILIQQLHALFGRALKFPLSDSSLPADLPSAAERAGKFLYFDNDGNLSLVAMTPRTDTLFGGNLAGIADGVNVTFTLTDDGDPISATPLQVTVWCNYPLVAGVGYNLGPMPGQVTFTTAPQSGDTLFAQGTLA